MKLQFWRVAVGVCKKWRLQRKGARDRAMAPASRTSIRRNPPPSVAVSSIAPTPQPALAGFTLRSGKSEQRRFHFVSGLPAQGDQELMIAAVGSRTFRTKTPASSRLASSVLRSLQSTRSQAAEACGTPPLHLE